jgi:hypothetical protein
MKFLALLMLLSTTAFAQNLMKERIWKLSPRKRSIFLDKGVFHAVTGQSGGQVVGVRNSFVKSRGYERIVIDFNTQKIPNVYGHIAQKENKVYLDFFNSQLGKTLNPLQNTKYVDNVDFFGIDGSNLSVELRLKSASSYDIFYLEKPWKACY